MVRDAPLPSTGDRGRAWCILHDVTLSERTRAIAEVVIAYLALGVWLFAGGRTLGGALSRWSANASIAAQIVSTAAFATLVVWVATRRDRDARASLGLARAPLARVVKNGVAGALVSYALTTVAVAAFFLLTRVSPEQAAATKAKGLATFSKASPFVMLPLVVLVGFYEELFFRGLLLGRLRRILGRERDVAAIVITSALFALGHGYQGSLGLVQTFVAGLVLSSLAVRTGTIWASVVGHVTIDAVSVILLHVVRRASAL